MANLLSRRVFLERAAAASVAGAVIPRWLGAAQAPGMFISLNGAVARGVQWPEYARLAARIGYGGVDFPLAAVRTAGVDATRALLAELKLRPTIASLPFSIQGAQAQFDTGLAALDETAGFMADIGASRIMAVMPATVPASANQPFAEFRAFYKARVAAVADVLRRHNIRLGLEFLGPMCMHLGTCGGGARGGAAAGAPPATPTPPPPATPFLYTLPETIKLASEAGPNVGAILDVWHWHHSGGTAADIVATEPARIVHVHMSDARAMPPEDVRDQMRQMPGEGIIDYGAFLGALKRIGYTGGLAPEPLGRVPMDMPAEESAKLAYDTTLAVMKKAGVA